MRSAQAGSKHPSDICLISYTLPKGGEVGGGTELLNASSGLRYEGVQGKWSLPKAIWSVLGRCL